jgi:hypothetical protein
MQGSRFVSGFTPRANDLLHRKSVIFLEKKRTNILRFIITNLTKNKILAQKISIENNIQGAVHISPGQHPGLMLCATHNSRPEGAREQMFRQTAFSLPFLGDVNFWGLLYP